jgi:ferredoxin-NADP reductase
MKQLMFKEKRKIARETLEIHFEKPVDLVYIPGQAISIRLPELRYPDKRGPQRTFTIASAPREEDLFITTRDTGSGFKKTLSELNSGTVLEYAGPLGSFTLDLEYPAVFIAGGIGITPFHSILFDDLESKYDFPLVLLYSNSTLDRTAYHDKFEEVQRSGSFDFRYILTLTQPDVSWQGERRRIDIDFIGNYVPDLSQNIFYVCGPPGLVQDITGILKAADIAEEKIRFESFWGY